ncbi:hypothetical protein RND71_016268 [Anisodus tanguticus]|uniref:Uncharacterized protein n=1 Tax=Anisodus tanguticus TaxID=243964 RepID=A0AAE1S7X4_9SOLA|nr:hypothetical protein RND71_016268 [Anisodus tanguticus]
MKMLRCTSRRAVQSEGDTCSDNQKDGINFETISTGITQFRDRMREFWSKYQIEDHQSSLYPPLACISPLPSAVGTLSPGSLGVSYGYPLIVFLPVLYFYQYGSNHKFSKTHGKQIIEKERYKYEPIRSKPAKEELQKGEIVPVKESPNKRGLSAQNQIMAVGLGAWCGESKNFSVLEKDKVLKDDVDEDLLTDEDAMSQDEEDVFSSSWSGSSEGGEFPNLHEPKEKRVQSTKNSVYQSGSVLGRP